MISAIHARSDVRPRKDKDMPNMDTTQLFTIVNAVAKQSMGTEDIDVLDTSSLVALGDAVLSSQTNTEAFLNTLVQRIGKTIISYRPYTSQLTLLDVGDMEFGQIMQKTKTQMPIAITDDTYNLVDGESLDMYVVSKPEVHQKLFVKRTPLAFMKTFQTKALKEAFTSAEAMGTFVASIYGEIRNAIELAQENLGRLTMANYMANVSAQQVYDLVTLYNKATGEVIATGETALQNEAFLRFALQKIKNVSSKMQTMSTLYNDGTEQRHTPAQLQRFVTLTDFRTALETQVDYMAFNEKYVKLASDIEVPYWQAQQSPFDIEVTGESSKEEKTIKNVVAFIHDRDALGTYRKEEEVLTTPVNARGRYYNTYYHIDNLYFNDTSENGAIFTLN